jgi:hypothetical protein
MAIEVGWVAPGLLKVVWPESFDLAELEDFTRRHDEFTRAPYAVIHESEARPEFQARHRRVLTEWMARSGGLHDTYCRGVAFVTPSPIIRGVITAIFWMAHRRYPMQVFDDRGPALAWLEERMRAK